MERTSQPKALIVGAGIGGLTAAIALRRAGIEAVVFERASDLRKVQVGGGIVLWTNAVHALQQVDMAERALAVATPVERAEFRDSDGALLAGWVPRNKPGAPSLGVSRAELLPVLAGALDDGVLRLGATCTGFEQDAEGVTARLADGREERGDLLIAADGKESGLRAQLGKTPPGFPPYAHYTLWHGIADPGFAHELAPAGLFGQVFGCGTRFIYYHVGHGRVYWLAKGYVPPGGRDPDGGRKPALLARFGGSPEPAPALIAGTDESGISRMDIFGDAPLESWGAGRVTLLGDAAHPMSTMGGFGAGMAIEDGVALAKCLGAHPDVPAALRAYEAQRIARTTSTMRLSRSMNSSELRERPVPCWIRNRFVKLMFNRAVEPRIQKVLAHEV